MHLDVCLYVENCVLIGLDWVEPMMQIFFAYHMFMHFLCIRTLSLLYILVPVMMVFFCFSLSLSLSPSLSLIVYALHPSANSLRLKTLFFLRHLPLILLLFTFSSVMRRPIKTSRITSPNVVFIRNTTWFYQTFPILLYPLSFTVEDRQIYVRYPWVVPLWSYKSSTLTRTVLIPLYLGLLCRFEVHVL